MFLYRTLPMRHVDDSPGASTSTLTATTISFWHRYCIEGASRYGGDYARNHLSQRALEIIEQQAQQAGARRVTGVWLKVGAFSCVEASALTFCFELVCRGTLAEGCELHIAEQQAECWCDRCQQYVHLVSQHVRRCPHCNNDQLQIVADDGLQIQRLELE